MDELFQWKLEMLEYFTFKYLDIYLLLIIHLFKFYTYGCFAHMGAYGSQKK